MKLCQKSYLIDIKTLLVIWQSSHGQEDGGDEEKSSVGKSMI